MLVSQAKEVARQWVNREGSRLPGFTGAFLTGSILWLADGDTLPTTSDVDVMLVLESPPTLKLGKFVYAGLLLEVSYMAPEQLQSAEEILGQSHMAGNFSRTEMLMDLTGQLTTVQAVVAREYAQPRWVRARCAEVQAKALRWLATPDESLPFHDQVTSWLFGTSLSTHILLMAGLGNATVRKRYVASRVLLAEYGYLDFHETLLTQLGCQAMSPGSVAGHLQWVAELFDAAQQTLKTPYRFGADLSPDGRSVAIDGSRELIQQGLHREAIFWLVATASRCQHVLAVDGSPEVQASFLDGYQRLVGDLGISSLVDLQMRCRQSRDFLPQVWQVAEAIMAVNPEIQG